jgi:CheY-like chemotaxis protein
MRGHAERTPDVMTVNGRVMPDRPLVRRRLLVVEDDPGIRTALRAGLELHGYEVAIAGNGLEALEALARLMPDLIVLDLALPSMSGQRFVEELTGKGLRPHLRIVVVSVNPDGHDQARAMGADGYLRKPLQLAALVREIERVLGS